MARATLTVQTLAVAGIADLTFTPPTDHGEGEGVEVASNNSQIAVLLVKGPSSGSGVVTVPANGAKSKGVAIPDLTLTVATGKVGALWVPPDYYATGGKVFADVNEAGADMAFAAIRVPVNWA